MPKNKAPKANIQKKTVQSGSHALTVVFRVPSVRQIIDAEKAGGRAILALLEKLIVSVDLDGHALDDPLAVGIDHLEALAGAIFGGGLPGEGNGGAR